MKDFETLSLNDKLLKKIYAYYQTIWRDKWKEGIENEWLSNFTDDDDDIDQKEKLNMLWLLSKFMYFGNHELRQLLFSLYRDLFKYPVIEAIRQKNSDTIDMVKINAAFKSEINATRFLGVGNPSESGVHMLYYFRQECNLPKDFFLNASDIFSTKQIVETLSDGSEKSYLKSELGDKTIKRYVFIDDFCGSGDQARSYLEQLVKNIKFEDPCIEVSYLMLFGTVAGVANVKALGVFNQVAAVYTIDDTFKTFSDNSRYFTAIPTEIEKIFSETTARKYGNNLFNPPLGHGDCQLLIGFFHNTPDNSLPIFWSEHNNWKPIFKRYHKF